jgi:hypothetical protein
MTILLKNEERSKVECENQRKLELMIIRGRLGLVVILPDIIWRRRSPRTIAVIANTTIWDGTWAPPSLYRRTATSSFFPIIIPDLPIIPVYTIPVYTTTGAARTVATGSIWRRRARASLVAPHRGRRIFRPLEIYVRSDGDKRKSKR